MNKKIFFTLLSTIWTTIWKQLQTSFRYRRAGGDDNNKLPGNNCQAKIDEIYGNTVKWNQLSQNPNFDTLNNWTIINPSTVKSYTVNNNVLTIVKKQGLGGGMFYNEVNGDTTHKYYMSVVGKVNENTSSSSRNVTRIGICLSTGSIGTNKQVTSNSTEFIRLSLITSPVNSSNKFFIGLGDSGTPNDVIGYLKNYRLIDITSIFGTDSQIASALGIQEADITTDIGVAAFEKWLELNVGEQDYYPYDPGNLISFKGQSVKSTGFNQWDEEWELGSWTATVGQASTKNDSSTTFCCSNPIDVQEKSGYYFYYGGNIPFKRLSFLDESYVVISTTSSFVNKIITTPERCRYIVFHISNGVNGDTPSYQNDICINFSDPAKNGIYKPYWEDSVDLSFAQNIPDPSDPSQPLFPYGLCSAGSVHDEVSATTATKRIGQIYNTELSASDVIYLQQYSAFRFALPNANPYETRYMPIQCYGYENIYNGESFDSNWDKVIFNVVLNNQQLCTIVDKSISSIEMFLQKTFAVYYPIIEIHIPSTYFMTYKVDKYSTEELIVPSDSTGAPTSTPIIADITYKYKGGGYNWIGTELEYIESTGTQWIDTGIKLTSDDIIISKFQTPENLNGALYGIYGSDGSDVNTAFYFSSNSYYLYPLNNYTDKIVVGNYNTWWNTIIHDFIHGKFVFNDTEFLFTTYQFQNNTNNYLFSRYYTNRGEYGYYFYGRVEYYKIIRNGNKILDLVPYIDPHGIVCMYDRVSGNFFYNQGTGEFKAGPRKY